MGTLYINNPGLFQIISTFSFVTDTVGFFFSEGLFFNLDTFQSGMACLYHLPSPR